MNLGNRFNQHSFASIPNVNMARSKFDRSFAVKDTFDFDYLVPIFADEILPGDTVNLNVKSFARLATQVVPLMDNMYMDYYFFFVPNRLVWENWERFNGAQDDPGDSTDFLVPEITSGAYAVGSIMDHFGIPTGVAPGSYSHICAFPFRAYQLIWNEWFRDENLQNSIVVAKDNGPDTYTNYTLLKAAKNTITSLRLCRILKKVPLLLNSMLPELFLLFVIRTHLRGSFLMLERILLRQTQLSTPLAETSPVTLAPLSLSILTVD